MAAPMIRIRIPDSIAAPLSAEYPDENPSFLVRAAVTILAEMPACERARLMESVRATATVRIGRPPFKRPQG